MVSFRLIILVFSFKSFLSAGGQKYGGDSPSQASLYHFERALHFSSIDNVCMRMIIDRMYGLLATTETQPQVFLININSTYSREFPGNGRCIALLKQTFPSRTILRTRSAYSTLFSRP
jgi:hypothetical protein